MPDVQARPDIPAARPPTRPRSVLKRLGRSPAARAGLGRLAAGYLRLLRATTRFVVEPAEAHARVVRASWPVIGATWHGQHLMVPLVCRPGDRVATLVSRSGDGGLNAALLAGLGVRAIRGSGARGRDVRAKGGGPALRAMLRALADGESVALTADVPRIGRRCGEGIVLLAALSGRPIVPMALATRWRLTFGSWDRATLGLPFGRGAIVMGAPLHVPRDADPAAREDARRTVEAELDRVHARAFALVGRADPLAPARGPRP